MSKKWKSVWLVTALCLIGSIAIFKYDPGFAGYLLGAAIVLPSYTLYYEKQ